MALSLFSDIPDTCYTSQLQKIEIETDATSVSLTITHQATSWFFGNGQTQIFESEYATYNNSLLTIYDIGAFLETFMAQKDGLQQFIFKFSTASESLTRTLVVIYCKQQPIMTAADLANSNFITNYFTRLVYRGAHDQLPYFAGFGSPGGYTSYSLHYTVHYRTPSGTTGTYAFDHYGRASYGVAEINTSPESVRLMCKDFLPEGSELLAYTLQEGNRTARFFVAEQTVVRQFMFRNAYGCLEYLCLPTARTEKTETKSSTAVCGDSRMLYDITHTRTFEEQTPVLQRAEARRFRESSSPPPIPLSSLIIRNILSSLRTMTSPSPTRSARATRSSSHGSSLRSTRRSSTRTTPAFSPPSTPRSSPNPRRYAHYRTTHRRPSAGRSPKVHPCFQRHHVGYMERAYHLA